MAQGMGTASALELFVSINVARETGKPMRRRGSMPPADLGGGTESNLCMNLRNYEELVAHQKVIILE